MNFVRRFGQVVLPALVFTLGACAEHELPAVDGESSALAASSEAGAWSPHHEGATQFIWLPPSTLIACPVISLAASEARKTASSPMSSGV